MRRFLKWLAIGAAVFAAWLLAVWPPPYWYRTHWPRETAFMSRPLPIPATAKALARGRLYHPVPLDSIAPAMRDAAMIGEDDRFMLHSGIDYVALAQALGYTRQTFDWRNPRERRELLGLLPAAWKNRDRLRGASTITQQLAKNLYLSPSRNPLRKLKEAVIAWRLEAVLGKRRIMELYLNTVELGDNVWGVDAASELYFGHRARSLSDEEAAALAGTLPFPLYSNPDRRPGRMHWRQDLILRRMHGEQVEVPRPEEEGASGLPADSAVTTVPNSTALDSLVPVMPDSLTPDSSRSPPSARGDTASGPPTPAGTDSTRAGEAAPPEDRW